MDWINKVNTPCYVIDERRLRENLEILGDVKRRAENWDIKNPQRGGEGSLWNLCEKH